MAKKTEEDTGGLLLRIDSIVLEFEEATLMPRALIECEATLVDLGPDTWRAMLKAFGEATKQLLGDLKELDGYGRNGDESIQPQEVSP